MSIVKWSDIKHLKPEDFNDLIFPCFVMDNITNIRWRNVVFFGKIIHVAIFVFIFYSYLHNLTHVKFSMWS